MVEPNAAYPASRPESLATDPLGSCTPRNIADAISPAVIRVQRHQVRKDNTSPTTTLVIFRQHTPTIAGEVGAERGLRHFSISWQVLL